jgi:hypothetical protein
MAKDRRRSVEGPGVGFAVRGKTMIFCLANYAQLLVLLYCSVPVPVMIELFTLWQMRRCNVWALPPWLSGLCSKPSNAWSTLFERRTAIPLSPLGVILSLAIPQNTESAKGTVVAQRYGRP